MFRATAWLLRLASGLGHRLRRRLTRAGLLAFAVLVLGAALGVDTERTLAFQVFTLALALLLVALAGSVRFGVRTRLSRVLPPFASVGEPLRYRVVVHNDGTGVERGLGVLDELADPRPSSAALAACAGPARSPRAALRAWRALLARLPVHGPVEGELPELPPGASAVTWLEFTPRRRGVVQFERLTVWRPDALGLARALRAHRAPASLVVLPVRYPVPALRVAGRRVYQHGGVTLATSVGDSEEFLGLRDYRAGDPLQRIHWKSFARAGRPIVKEYHSEFFERHALVLDTFAVAEDAVFEEAVCVAASFACTLDTQENLLDLVFVGADTYCYTAGRGQLQPDRLLEVLAHVRACAHRPFRVLHDSVLQRRAGLSGAIVVLLAWDDARRAFVEALHASGLPLLVLRIAPPGEAGGAPVPGVHAVEVGRAAAGLAALAGAER